MPQNTPMKRQFTTIDGRTVMSNLPQHWGGNDWKITGVDNPLPVANYVQTEAGVWIPQKGSDDGAADVRLTGSIVEDKIVDSLALRDTSAHFFRAEDINFKKVFLYVYSTLDVDVTFYLRPLTTGRNIPLSWDGSSWKNDDGFIISPEFNNRIYLVNTYLKWLNDFIKAGNWFEVRLQARDIPTSGSISVVMNGVTG